MAEDGAFRACFCFQISAAPRRSVWFRISGGQKGRGGGAVRIQANPRLWLLTSWLGSRRCARALARRQRGSSAPPKRVVIDGPRKSFTLLAINGPKLAFLSSQQYNGVIIRHRKKGAARLRLFRTVKPMAVDTALMFGKREAGEPWGNSPRPRSCQSYSGAQPPGAKILSGVATPASRQFFRQLQAFHAGVGGQFRSPSSRPVRQDPLVPGGLVQRLSSSKLMG